MKRLLSKTIQRDPEQIAFCRLNHGFNRELQVIHKAMIMLAHQKALMKNTALIVCTNIK